MDELMAAMADLGLDEESEALEHSEDSHSNVSGPSEGNSEGNSALTQAGVWLPWEQIQDEILVAFLMDEEEWEGENGEPKEAMSSLAKRLRSSVEEFRGIVENTSPQIFEQKRLLKLLEAERIRNKAYRWDQVEELALAKIHNLVERGLVRKLPELLAIAQTANRASRKVGGPDGGAPMIPNLTQVNIQMNGDGSVNSVLPGPGNLGVMKLSLSSRALTQISKGKVIDADALPLSQRIEMLGPVDVPGLGKIADEC
jgi:hypothetical protein